MQLADEIEPLTEQIKRRGFFATIGEGLGSLSGFFDEVMVKCNNLTETNYNLACELAHQGAIDDAIMRFRVTLWLAPDHIPSLYNLACLYHHKGMNNKAMQLFTKVIRLAPNHHNALFMIGTMNPALLKPEMRPRTMPLEMAVEYFDGLAQTYEYTQQTRSYQLPALVHQLLHIETDKMDQRHDLIDLGCGTGLCGAQFREEFVNVVGVDFSNMMLDIAYRKTDRRGVKIFTRLAHKDMRSYLHTEEKEASFDVALCISVLPYMGDVDLAFSGVQRVLRPGGLFAVSFDPYVLPAGVNAGEGFGIMPKSGYFGHRLDYVEQRANALGMQTVRTGEVLSHPQTNVQLCFFRKV
jgi:predicted TPR repeat methyltransferase